MKTSKGFVAVTPEGEFLSYSETTTHTGRHFTVNTVNSIDEATVSRVPAVGVMGRRAELPPGTRWVPVTVRREVILEGYGIKPEGDSTP